MDPRPPAAPPIVPSASTTPPNPTALPSSPALIHANLLLHLPFPAYFSIDISSQLRPIGAPTPTDTHAISSTSCIPPQDRLEILHPGFASCGFTSPNNAVVPIQENLDDSMSTTDATVNGPVNQRLAAVSGRSSNFPPSFHEKNPKNDEISQFIDGETNLNFSTWRGLKGIRSKRSRSSQFTIVHIEDGFTSEKRSKFCINDGTRSAGARSNIVLETDGGQNGYIPGLTYGFRKDAKFSCAITGAHVSSDGMLIRAGAVSKLEQLALIACELTLSKGRRTPRKRRQHYSAVIAETAESARCHCSYSYAGNLRSHLPSKSSRRQQIRSYQEILTASTSSNLTQDSPCPQIQMLRKVKKKRAKFKVKASQNRKCVRTAESSRDRQELTRVQRCAKHVLNFVGEDIIHEKTIRQALGNNPDTSKAIRLLLDQQKLGRFGGGGRKDPFKYKATQSGLFELELSAADNQERVAAAAASSSQVSCPSAMSGIYSSVSATVPDY